MWGSVNSEIGKGNTFVGRQQEMAVLETALDDALSGRGQIVMIAGEPGIGKTRLAQELASHAETLGAQVWWGWCLEQQGAPPYWPWVQPIRSYIQGAETDSLGAHMGPGATDIGEIIPEIHDKLPNLEKTSPFEPQQARFRLFDAISNFLSAIAASQPLVLVLEDLQWADQPSLLLLEFLAGRLPDTKVLLVGTYRDIEVSREHPLSNTLALLARNDSYSRAELGGLESEHVGQLIKNISGEEPSQALVQAIYGHAEGNPFFSTEITRLLGDRILDADSNEYGAGGLEIPQSVLEVIGRRLSRLSRECESVLTTAAVIGRRFDFRLLGSLNEGTSENQLLDLIDEGLDANLIQGVSGQEDTYQFSHALVQQTLRERLSSSRRVRLHAKIGQTLEMLYADNLGDHGAELAYHFAEAASVAGVGKLAKYSGLAGESALAASAFEEALHHFEVGLVSVDITLDGSQKALNEEAAGLLFGLGCAQLATVERQSLPGAVACLRRAFDYYAEAGDVDRAVAIAQQPLPMAVGMLPGAAQLTRRALELVPRGSLDEARLLSPHSMHLCVVENDFEAARDAYTKALAIAQRENDEELEFSTLGNAATVDQFNWRLHESLEKGLRGLDLAPRVDNPWAELMVLYRVAAGRMLTGDLQGSKPHIERMRELAEKLRDSFWLTSAFFWSAQASAYEGDWEASRNFSDQAFTILQMDVRSLAPRMQLEFEVGEFAEGEIYLERILDAMRLASPGPNLEYMTTALGLPFVARITGDTSHVEVAEAVAAPILAAAANCSAVIMVGTRAGLAFLSAQREDSTAAADDYAFLAPYRGTAMPAFSFVFDRLLGLLAQTMGSLDLAVEHYEDALTFCRNGGYRPELAWTCHDYAETLVQRNGPGDRAKVSSLLEESLAISTELGMRPLIDRIAGLRERVGAQPIRAPAYPDGLTEREVEVLRLVAAGRTDREIAEELIIAVRTATTHVGNILNKTGAANRAEAASYANQQGLVGI